MGSRTKIASQESIVVLQQGVSDWNEWRKDKDGPFLNLSGADLKKRDLSGAELCQTSFRGADLKEVNFSGCDLFQADLRESDLQGADLSKIKGSLLSKQLGGSDLTGAKLPEPLTKLYDSLSSVKDISDNAQKLFLALVTGCLYSWLTIAQTTDVELITNRATSPLPIIQAAIPLIGFYVVAPLILLCLYFYFHFYLQKLWEELGSLPAVFTDGRQLHSRTDPWLLNDLVRSHFAKLRDGRPFLSYFQAWLSVLLAWWLVPTTVFLFWVRFLPRHDLFWTTVHVSILALAIFSALRLYSIARRTLRGEEPAVFRLKVVMKHRSTYLRLGFVTALGAILIAISLGAIFGVHPTGEPSLPLQIHVRQTWVPWLLGRFGYYPFADLANGEVSIKPSNWTGKRDEELDLVKGASLPRCNLSYAEAAHAFLVKANLSGAYMEHADLYHADLRQANLDFANLEGAELFAGSLQDASMANVNLGSTSLGKARLDRAQMDGASLLNAEVTNAELMDASLIKADLSQADFRDSNLSRVDLLAANLTGTDFRNVNLQGANLSGANLTGTRLEGANIRYVDFRNTLFPGNIMAPLQTRGLTREMITTAQDWEFALYDSKMLDQLGLPRDNNERVWEQMKAKRANTSHSPDSADPKQAR